MDQPKFKNDYEKIVNLLIKNINFYVLCITTFVQQHCRTVQTLLINYLFLNRYVFKVRLAHENQMFTLFQNFLPKCQLSDFTLLSARILK